MLHPPSSKLPGAINPILCSAKIISVVKFSVAWLVLLVHGFICSWYEVDPSLDHDTRFSIWQVKDASVVGASLLLDTPDRFQFKVEF